MGGRNKSETGNLKDLWEKQYGSKGLFDIAGHWSGGKVTWSWNELEDLKRSARDADDVHSIEQAQALLASQFEYSPTDTLKTTKFNPDILTIEYVALKKNLKLPGALATFTDNFLPRFHKENVYGRMDPVATYQGTTRTVDFAWTIDILGDPSQTDGMLKAVGDLAKFMYPVYQTADGKKMGTGTLVAPPLLRFRLSNASGGNLNLMRNTSPGATTEGLLAIVDSFKYLTYTAGIRGGELNVTRLIDRNGQLALVPTHVEVSFGLTILHENAKVGWTWNRDDAFSGTNTITFGQTADYPYGYGTTLSDTAASAPVSPADDTVEAGALKGDQSTLEAAGDAAATLTGTGAIPGLGAGVENIPGRPD